MGNGAKALQKRERKGYINNSKPTSQIKTNEAAMSIFCSTCKQPFFITTRRPALEEHSQNKHSKSIEECFPNFKL